MPTNLNLPKFFVASIAAQVALALDIRTPLAGQRSMPIYNPWFARKL
jgi:hypothetical protein